jgi:hypothetical protein
MAADKSLPNRLLATLPVMWAATVDVASLGPLVSAT